MAKKKTTADETAVYKVLISCGNSDTGSRFVPGDTVTADDFTQSVIDNWLEIEPPVLEKVS